jgi:hypothetical protein
MEQSENNEQPELDNFKIKDSLQFMKEEIISKLKLLVKEYKKKYGQKGRNAVIFSIGIFSVPHLFLRS